MSRTRAQQKRNRTVAQQKKDRQDIFLEKLEKVRCNVTKACRLTRISRQVVWMWVNEPDGIFKDRMAEVERTQFDFVQEKFLDGIAKGNGANQRYYLKTKGKKFGYGNGIEISGPDGGPIVLARDELTDPALTSAIKKLQELDPSLLIALTSDEE